MNFDVVIAAAGKSERMGKDKMLSVLFSNLSTIERTIEVFLEIENIDSIIVVIPKGSEASYKELDFFGSKERISFVEGGANRAESVFKGLQFVQSEGVLIHDGARPFLSKDLIFRVMQKVEEKGSCVPIIKTDDSLRKVEAEKITKIKNRESIYAVQTPQGYLTSEIEKAYKGLVASKKDFSVYTDESQILLEFVAPPWTVEGDVKNKKITHPHDIVYGVNKRVGCGYDLHRLEKGRNLIICGEKIKFEYGCLAHSDGDVGIHSLIDALFSAIGERDIGYNFPDSDPQYYGIESSKLLKKTMTILREKNYRVDSASIIILLEQPKISEYIPKMRKRMANLLEIPLEKIAISAKTNEGVGEIGDKKAIVAYAIALVI